METLYTLEKLMETKDKIRNNMLIQRNHLSVQEKHALSEQIMQNLIHYLATEEVKHILLYADFRNEVETKLLADVLFGT
jgi:5-formyltetrahydrofolate cyclo-ligase